MSREKLISTLDELERNFNTLSEKRFKENCKNAEPFTKWTRSNRKNAKPIAKWTRANRKNEKN